MLVEYELRNSGLPRTTATLFDLLDFLSTNACKVHLLKRGDLFENDKYITLWPIVGYRVNNISKIIQRLELPPNFESKLIELSERTCAYVKELVSRDFEYAYLNERINDLRSDYNSLLNRLDSLSSNQNNITLSKQIKKLNKLNHKYNIVFQNSSCDNENVLFTGDVEKAHMKKIVNDTNITLYEKYKYIKIPHHGTKKHFFDYSIYSPDFVIITNGKVNTRYSNSYKICSGYGTLNAIHLCTNSNHCVNCTLSCVNSTCVCSNGRKLVYSSLFDTI